MHASASSRFSSVNTETGIAPPGGLSWNDKHTVLSWNPSQRLGVQTRYTVTVDKGLKGAHGGVSAQARTAMLTTIAAPSVRMTQPAHGATNAHRYGATIY